eukprot:NODE_1032_length_2528_cov_0.997530.p4 type:complete len:119 gc:universal NODE_1032_length_2528_cov_0.997530:39-395(+)
MSLPVLVLCDNLIGKLIIFDIGTRFSLAPFNSYILLSIISVIDFLRLKLNKLNCVPLKFEVLYNDSLTESIILVEGFWISYLITITSFIRYPCFTSTHLNVIFVCRNMRNRCRTTTED